MTYQVPQHIDTNKIFLVNRSEIEGRLDPKMALYNKKVQHALFPMVKLKNLLLSKPQYGANEAGLDRLNNTQPRYIRITDIDENGLLSTDELGATVANVERKYILNKDDILIARSGATVGKSYIHKDLPYTCLFAGYLIRFLVNPQKILPDYLFSYTQLNSYKEWVNAIQRPSAQPNINAEEYQSLDIPLPDLPKQKEIVDFLSNAYFEKQQKEQQAEDILNSIDDFLLGELGIQLPEKKAQTLQYRIFTVNFSEVDERLDPFYYQTKYKVIDDIINIFPNKCNLGDVIISLNNGIEVRDYVEKGYRYMRVTDMGKHELNNASVKYINIANIPNRIKLNENCILVSRSGSLGLISEVNKDMLEYVLSSHIFKVELNPKSIYPKYAVEILRNKICQNQIFRNNNGGIIPEIQQDALKSIKIPLPSLEKQQEIVNHITAIRQQAKALQEEGKAILEEAKREVEKMILG
ncbi:MAG: restriction endonuclease subunit S [Bacteroidales bacterium]|nr:restriction endonuclease subunit S [Bacteroidales bacterium]